MIAVVMVLLACHKLKFERYGYLYFLKCNLWFLNDMIIASEAIKISKE